MREILNDLEGGGLPADPDPMRSAREKMRPPLPRRFYRTVATAQDEAGFTVRLDGKAVRTPMVATLLLPTRPAAELVAGEYAAQGDEIDALTMPVTRLVNTALDGVAADMQAVMEDILRYASTDLVCYRAGSPETLVERQSEAWDPVLDWAQAELGARFMLAEGVMHVEQPRQSIAALGVHLGLRREPLRLAALHVMTTLMGSALLALAVEHGAMEAEAAWKAAHVDEDWNIQQWGEDAEAAGRRVARRRDMMGAVALLEALDG